jgi:NAD(P)-dependent dehydrogenase (short-subunit alcohol dehydrogenase family)
VKLDRAVALVTGANRGLGQSIVHELERAKASRIYAGTRDLAHFGTGSLIGPVTPIELDITDAGQVARAASDSSDVTLLVNNAGLLPRGGALTISEGDLREAVEVNLIGTWRMAKAFAPVIRANGGGVIVNVLSLISLHNEPMFAAYSAAKAASWAITQSLRAELAGSGIDVIACFPGGIDTEMLAGIPAMKTRPGDVAREIVAGIARADPIIFPDRVSAQHGPFLLPANA